MDESQFKRLGQESRDIVGADLAGQFFGRFAGNQDQGTASGVLLQLGHPIGDDRAVRQIQVCDNSLNGGIVQLGEACLASGGGNGFVSFAGNDCFKIITNRIVVIDDQDFCHFPGVPQIKSRLIFIVDLATPSVNRPKPIFIWNILSK